MIKQMWLWKEQRQENVGHQAGPSRVYASAAVTVKPCVSLKVSPVANAKAFVTNATAVKYVEIN